MTSPQLKDTFCPISPHIHNDRNYRGHKRSKASKIALVFLGEKAIPPGTYYHISSSRPLERLFIIFLLVVQDSQWTKPDHREREAKPKIPAHISAEIFMLNHINFCLISRNIALGAALWRKTFPSSHTHTYAHVFYLPQEPYINLPIFLTQHRVRDQKSWNFYANFSNNLNKQITKRRRPTLRRWSKRMGRENQE